jgi:hypothetical protein
LRQTPTAAPDGQRKKEGAGEGNPSACEAWMCSLLLVANASDQQFVKGGSETNGYTCENHGHFTPRPGQFAPANPQFVPDSFRFDPFRVKII